MNMDMGMLTIFAALGVITIMSGLVLFVSYRHSKDNQRQSALMLKAMLKNTENINGFDKKITTLNSINAESLQYQQRAFEHQRMLVMSMNQQLKSITQLMVKGPSKAQPQSFSQSQNVQLKRAKTSNNFQKASSLGASARRTINDAIGAKANIKGVIKLEDLLKGARSQETSLAPVVTSESDTEQAVQMPIQYADQEIRRVANG